MLADRNRFCRLGTMLSSVKVCYHQYEIVLSSSSSSEQSLKKLGFHMKEMNASS